MIDFRLLNAGRGGPQPAFMGDLVQVDALPVERGPEDTKRAELPQRVKAVPFKEYDAAVQQIVKVF